MPNKEHVRMLREDVQRWNKWRQGYAATIPDLKTADLSGANLAGADLSDANLRGANLKGTDLSRADLNGANLNEARLNETILIQAKLSRATLNRVYSNKGNLSGADLSWADLADAKFENAHLNSTDLTRTYLAGVHFQDTNLRGANFSGARVMSTFFERTILDEANFTGAKLRRAHFSDINLANVRGLDTIEHEAPSDISISTIYRSSGIIPFAFLRGAGVPDNFIEYMASLTGNAFEYYSCFISYSGKNQDFAERLFADLQSQGVRCWFAPHHAQAGRKLHEQIDTAIRLHDKLLLILSHDSINSEWVKTEIKKAAKRETSEKTYVLFPISLISYDELRSWECWDGNTGKDLADEVREYLIPDFSKWKDHDSYKKALSNLMRDLASGKRKESNHSTT